MAILAEQGAGWEVQRGFITPDRAQVLGEQALAIIGEANQLIAYIDDSVHPALNDVGIYEAEDWDSAEWQDNPLAVYLQQTAPDLLQLAQSIMAGRDGPNDDLIALNHFEPGGYLDEHKDRGHVSRHVIGLIGDRCVIVRDLATQDLRQFWLSPGDLFHIDNSGLRPEHLAFNPSQTDRCLSFVK